MFQACEVKIAKIAAHSAPKIEPGKLSSYVQSVINIGLLVTIRGSLCKHSLTREERLNELRGIDKADAL